MWVKSLDQVSVQVFGEKEMAQRSFLSPITASDDMKKNHDHIAQEQSWKKEGKMACNNLAWWSGDAFQRWRGV